jgi:cell division protein FtsQ
MRSLNNSSDIVISADDRPSAFSASERSHAFGAREQSGTFSGIKRQRKKPEQDSPEPKRAKVKARKTRRFKGPILTPVQKFAAIGVATAAFIMSGLIVWHSGWPQKMVRSLDDEMLSLTAEAGFKVGDITVSGRDRTESAAILAALGARRDSPILGIDLSDAKARLEEIPTVQTATVERRLPDTLRVTLSERRPVAIWQHDGVFMLVDKDGHPFPGSIDGYQQLPLIVGEGAPVASAELFAELAKQPALADRVKAAVRVSNRRWNLRLDDPQHGLEARLPENDLDGALKQLADLEKNRSLSSRHVEMVDLRVSDRMVVKTAPEQTATSPAPHKEGG